MLHITICLWSGGPQREIGIMHKKLSERVDIWSVVGISSPCSYYHHERPSCRGHWEHGGTGRWQCWLSSDVRKSGIVPKQCQVTLFLIWFRIFCQLPTPHHGPAPLEC